MKRSEMIELIENRLSDLTYARECGLSNEKYEDSYTAKVILEIIEAAGMLPPRLPEEEGLDLYDYQWESEND